MEADDLLRLVRDPDEIKLTDRYYLNELIRKYPAFQAPRLLLYLIDGDEDALKKAALHTANRWVIQQFRAAMQNETSSVSAVLDRMHTEPVNAFEKLSQPEKEPDTTPVVAHPVEPAPEETPTEDPTDLYEEPAYEWEASEETTPVEVEEPEPVSPLDELENEDFLEDSETEARDALAYQDSGEGSFFDNISDSDKSEPESEEPAEENETAPAQPSGGGSFFDDINADAEESKPEEPAEEKDAVSAQPSGGGSFFDEVNTDLEESKPEEPAEENETAPAQPSGGGSFFDDINADAEESKPEEPAEEKDAVSAQPSGGGSFFDEVNTDLEESKPEEPTEEKETAPAQLSGGGSFFDELNTTTEKENLFEEPDTASEPVPAKSESFFDTIDTDTNTEPALGWKKEGATAELDDFSGKYGREQLKEEPAPEAVPNPMQWAEEEFGGAVSIHQTAVVGDIPRPTWQRVDTAAMPGEEDRDQLPPEVYQVALSPDSAKKEDSPKEESAPAASPEVPPKKDTPENFFDQF